MPPGSTRDRARRGAVKPRTSFYPSCAWHEGITAGFSVHPQLQPSIGLGEAQNLPVEHLRRRVRSRARAVRCLPPDRPLTSGSPVPRSRISACGQKGGATAATLGRASCLNRLCCAARCPRSRPRQRISRSINDMSSRTRLCIWRTSPRSAFSLPISVSASTSCRIAARFLLLDETSGLSLKSTLRGRL